MIRSLREKVFHAAVVTFAVSSLLLAVRMSIVTTIRKQPRRTLLNPAELATDGLSELNYTRRFPSAIIIGARKAGTRALLEILNLHSKVATAAHEVHFFDNNTHYNAGFGWYLDQMPKSFPDQITIEKTPKYFIDPKVPRRISRMNPSMKLILIVRNPIDRVISDYTQVLEKHNDQNRSWHALEDLVLRKNDQIDPSYKAITISRYGDHLRNWLRHFPRNQIFIASSEMIVRSPVKVIEQLEQFLDVRREINNDYFVMNQTRGFFCFREVYQDPRTAQLTTLQYRPETRCLSSSKGRPHSPVDEGLRKKLFRYFYDENEYFFKLSGLRFDWNKEYGSTEDIQVALS